MARHKQSPVPHLIATEVLSQYKGVSLRVRGEKVSVVFRHPIHGQTTRVAGTTPNEVLRAVESAYEQITGDLKVVANPRTRFGEVAKGWSEHVLSKKRHSTQGSYKSCYNKWILPRFRNRPINEITKPDIKAFLNGVFAESHSIDTHNRLLNIWRGIMRYALAHGFIMYDPTEGLKAKPYEKTRHLDDYLEADEVKTLIDALPTVDNGEWYYPHLMVLAYTGLRISELAGCRVEDLTINADGTGLLEICGNLYEGVRGDTKTVAGSRRVHLLPQVVEAVRRLLSASDGQALFCTHTGSVLRATNFRRRVFNPLVAHCISEGLIVQHGTKAVTPHTLRHSYLTLLADAGTPAHILAAIAGHSRVDVTYERYIARRDSAARDAALGVQIPQ